MGGELVTQPTSKTCYQFFDDVFPYYLSIGMTYELFWERDCELAKAYKKAEEFRKKRMNEELWLSYKYMYETLPRVAPAFFGKKPNDYIERPFPLTKKEAQEIKHQEEQRKYKEYISTMVITAVDNRKQI